MNRNPLAPFGLIAIVGIVLMFGLSFVGLDKGKQLEKQAKNGGAQQTAAAPATPPAPAKSDNAKDSNPPAQKQDQAPAEKTASAAPAGKVDAKAAEKIAKSTCITCHGQNLEGQVGPSLKDVGSRLSEDEILNILQNGRNAMPKGLVQGDDAKNLAAWLATQK